jgi:hypothetical protein
MIPMNLNSDQALRAARQGRALHKYVNDDTVTGSFVVQTAAGIYYDIPAGKQVVIVGVMFGCESDDEFMSCYLVGCSAITAGGTPVQFMSHFDRYVGTKKTENVYAWELFQVPAIIKYSDGHRSVSMAVKATDTATVVSFGWCGWIEDEGTLS